MVLSQELISQFAKVVKQDKKVSETTVYGTVVTDGNGNKYVKLDGSDQLTPLSDDERPAADTTTTNSNEGDRVSVLIKNHTATVTGNISSPSVRTDDFDDQVSELTKVDILLADKIQANESYIKSLQADKANVGDLTAATARITELEAKDVTITGELDVAKADIDDLKTTKLDAEAADIKYATIESLNATNANVGTLEANYGEFQTVATNKFTSIEGNIQTLESEKISTTTADAKYANIDFSNIGKAAIEQFYATSGIIKDLVIGDTSVTGKLVGVTIVGDLIEGGTVKADKLVILGDDGLYYKLNTNGVTTSAEQTEYNSLNGSIITANTITAEKIKVDDLVAFDATIGGFNITESAIYSGAKSSADNTTRGIYLDKEGQLVAGDGSNFLKYYKDTDGNYKLAISAESFIFSSTGEKIEDTIDSSAKDLQDLITEQNKSIIDSCNNNIDKALENYVRNGDYTQYKESVKAQLEILANQIEMNFTSVTNSIDTVNTNSQNKFNEISKYIRFTIDGIELGANENTLKLTLDNDMIRFERNNETVGWWDGIDFHTGNISVDISEQAKFGNFAFVPRSDGSLMFLKVDSVIGGNLFSLSNCSYEENVDHYTAIGSTGATVYTSSTSKAGVYFILDPINTYRITYTSDNAGLSGFTSGGSLNFARKQNGRQLITVAGATKFYFYAIDTTKDNYTFRDVKIVEVV